MIKLLKFWEIPQMMSPVISRKFKKMKSNINGGEKLGKTSFGSLNMWLLDSFKRNFIGKRGQHIPVHLGDS